MLQVTNRRACAAGPSFTDIGLLEGTLHAMNAEHTLMYPSDWSHRDFDLPSSIMSSPFLFEQGRRNLLGETTREVFGP